MRPLLAHNSTCWHRARMLRARAQRCYESYTHACQTEGIRVCMALELYVCTLHTQACLASENNTLTGWRVSGNH
jgi:hypothetical protein